MENKKLEVTFGSVDPEVMALLTGQKIEGDTFYKPTPFSLEVRSPVKRTFWQWLRRKPREWKYLFVPNVTPS